MYVPVYVLKCMHVCEYVFPTYWQFVQLLNIVTRHFVKEKGKKKTTDLIKGINFN